MRDSIVDGAIIDGGVVADVIRQVFERSGIKTKEVVASLSGNAVIVKKITLPVMTTSEFDDSIYWEAEQYIPFDVQDVNLDYQVLEAAADSADRASMDVLLVAAKKEKIADYTGVISQAGRVPVVMDVDAFALQNAYEANYGIDMSRVNSDCPPSSMPARARSTSISSKGGSRCSPATSPSAATPTPRRCRRS